MIDTHCHVDLYETPEDVARECETTLVRAVAVTNLPSHYTLAVDHLGGYKHVRPALGLHPLVASKHSGELYKFVRLSRRAQLIGEIGLDFSKAGLPTRDVQERVFATIVRTIKDKPRFVTLHSRKAEDAVLSILKEASMYPVCFHWYSGSRANLIRLIDDGHFVSINPSMSASKKWQELILSVPRDRVLTETDGPHIKHDGRIVRPSDVGAVQAWLGEKWGLDVSNVNEQIHRNFFRLPGSEAFSDQTEPSVEP